MKQIFASAALAVALAACSPNAKDAANTTEQETTNDGTATVAPGTAPPVSSPAVPPTASAASKILRLEGLGDLTIGEPVPAKSSWAERGGQLSDFCRTISSPLSPGVYAIVEEGKVRRITVGGQSDIKLAEGIGVGSSEADVRKWFAGFRAEPHKYEAAPAKYLTAPNGASGDPALRLEIGQDGKVRLIHIGTKPVLNYVEGCS
jgi:hypothetical protein